MRNIIIVSAVIAVGYLLRSPLSDLIAAIGDSVFTGLFCC